MDLFDIINAIVKVVQTVITVKKAVDTKEEMEYQTEILKKEAINAEKQVAEERQTGIEEARKTRLKAILNMSKTKTDVASGNVLLSSPTAINLISDEKLNGELDALVTLKNSEKSAEKYINQTRKYYQNASLNSFKTKNQFFYSVSNSLVNLGGFSAKTASKYI